MDRVLVLGSRSAIGRKFLEALDGCKLEAVAISSAQCNLLDPESVDKLIAQLRQHVGTFRFAVQFSTTYGSADLPMARQVARVINALAIPRLVYLSSWVVMADQSLLSTSYIEAKRKCEAFYRDVWHNEPRKLRIVRPSVVIGDGALMHQRLLDRLARVSYLVPHCLARCFVDVDEVVSATLQIALNETDSLRTHCVLGPLRTVREAIGAVEPASHAERALYAALAPVRLLLAALVHALAYVCCYFRGWLALFVTPATEEDVLALCSPYNVQHVQVLGRGAIYKYYKQRFDHKLLINMRHHKGIVRCSEQSVVVRSGTTFADLLDNLTPTGRTLLVHPNYKYITAGAAVMVPVHGSSLTHPLVNNCILSITYMSGGQVLTRKPARADAGDSCDEVVCGPIDVVLEVELALSPLDTRTQTYTQSKRVLDRRMRGTDVCELLDGAVANAELRMNVPQLGEPWLLYTYTVAEAKKGDAFQLPQNWVGKLWDPFLKDGKGLLSRLGLEKVVVSAIDNYEIFLEADDFKRFADEYADNCTRWPFFKVLIRKCCSTSFFGHGRPLYAIDIAIMHSAKNHELSKQVFAKYPSAMLHPSKYVGPLHPTIPLLRCASHAHAR
jgi:nucleoside-diphosphate-sugar epimerase/sulfur carrier protein ThiS